MSTVKEYDTINFQDLPDTLSRFEVKYLCHISKYEQVKARLREELVAINFHGNTRQAYKNVYLDTPELTNYHDHHRGAFPRKKVRSRTYINSANSKTYHELKVKYSSGLSEKERFEEGTQLPELFNQYQPSLVVQYERIQFWNPKTSERLTLDTHLQFTEALGENGRSMQNLVIIEVKKKSKALSKTEQLLKKLGLTSQSFSKYCFGVAILKDVKKNNFKRIIKKIEQWESVV